MRGYTLDADTAGRFRERPLRSDNPEEPRVVALAVHEGERVIADHHSREPLPLADVLARREASEQFSI